MISIEQAPGSELKSISGQCGTADRTCAAGGDLRGGAHTQMLPRVPLNAVNGPVLVHYLVPIASALGRLLTFAHVDVSKDVSERESVFL